MKIDYESEILVLEKENYLNTYKLYFGFLKPEWFLNPYGIHGMKHIQRVMIHLASLSRVLKLSYREQHILYLSALYHDIGRTHDWEDDIHGIKSWEKAKKLNLLNEELEETKEIVKFIVEYHCISDSKAYVKLKSSNLSEETEKLFKIFKDADGLDRVRLGDLDPNYLRFKESKDRVKFAETLLFIYD